MNEGFVDATPITTPVTPVKMLLLGKLLLKEQNLLFQVLLAHLRGDNYVFPSFHLLVPMVSASLWCIETGVLG